MQYRSLQLFLILGVVPFGRESGKNIEGYDDEGDNALKMAKKVFFETFI